MKKSGLKNRFSEETRNEWLYWYDCMVCGKNQWSALHHIISPSCFCFVKGKHNESVLNSCPVHNFKCHIGNEAYLNNNVSMFLEKTKLALEDMGYELKEIDRDFLKIYKEIYI